MLTLGARPQLSVDTQNTWFRCKLCDDRKKNIMESCAEFIRLLHSTKAGRCLVRGLLHSMRYIKSSVMGCYTGPLLMLPPTTNEPKLPHMKPDLCRTRDLGYGVAQKSGQPGANTYMGEYVDSQQIGRFVVGS